MIPNVIKFVSVDKLVLYQQWNSNRPPEPVISRVGAYTPRCSWDIRNLDTIPESFHVRKREYELFDQYVDESNGNRVSEYRERL